MNQHIAESMQIVEFESPTLNDKGEILTWTRFAAKQCREDLDSGINLSMLVIPAGTFQMGSAHHVRNTEEQPQHFVTIKTFMMSKFLITQAQWKAIMGRLPPCRFKGDNLPVDRVSWRDAHQYCKRLSKKTKRAYQLPSETQWEYACRAGTNTPFSFGETLTIDVANFNGEHTFLNEPRGYYRHVTTEGGTFPPNAFGLYDMHGNLWEWCADSWLDHYVSSPRDSSIYQNKDSHYRVVRGGSWHEPPDLCRSSSRLQALESEADEFTGFRVVCAVSA